MVEEDSPVAHPDDGLRFAHFAGLFAPDDKSFEASLWRLGTALFDEPVERLGDEVNSEIKNAVRGLTFKTAVSDWLASTVSPAVTDDLAKEGNATDARRVFIMLTGHQVSRATEAAMDANNLHLAMLVSQAGGDATFKTHLQKQLDVWKADGADAHMDISYCKVLALLAGLTHLPRGQLASQAGQNVALTEGLDWKRAFGLYLWFTTSLEHNIEFAMDLFQAAVDERGAGSPKVLPWYAENPDKAKGLIAHPNLTKTATDALMELLQFNLDRSYDLTTVFRPTGFSPSPLDYRLPWHLSTLMTVVMRLANFKDREEHGRGGNDPDAPTLEEGIFGTSVQAQSITLNYALQLEYLGRREDALFVLLHLEQSEG